MAHIPRNRAGHTTAYRLLTGITVLLSLGGMAFAAGDEDESQGFQWRPALAESFFAFTIANAERFPTEKGTREALDGAFWKNYARDIQALHGWEDGDGFKTSYIAHPMEGAMAGYIERQNDPKYRSVEFGNSQRYWTSVMRSLAFSTAYNIAWSLSPYGEAGLGNVDLHAPGGLVDVVGSEIMGTGWMIGEDVLDRFLIKRIENKYQNPAIRAIARGMLNPIRSYSNLLRFKKPWYRDSRPGVVEYAPQGHYTPKDEKTGPPFRWSAWPKTPFELLGQPMAQQFLGPKGSTCIGGGGEAAIKMSNSLALLFDVDGCTLMGMHPPDSGDALTYTAGGRWSLPTRKRWVPYAQVLVGGTKITRDHVDEAKKAQAIKIAAETGQPYPELDQWVTTVDINGFTVVAGGGVFYRINEGVIFRVAHVSYQRSWLSSIPTLPDADYNQDLRFSFGVVVRFGPWERQ
jgi:hypothetical protein